MAIAEALLRLEDYLSLPDTGTRTELVQGRIIEMPPPEPKHGRFCGKIAMFVGIYVYEHQLGEVISNDAGVITRRNPDSLRGPDIAFYSQAKLPSNDTWEGYFDFVPDLVFEVRSPSDRWSEMVQKAGEYLAAGVPIVVVLNPDTKSAHIFEGDQAPRILGPEDTLSFPGILDGFALVVGRIFE